MSSALPIDAIPEPMAGEKAPAAERAWPHELFALPVNLDGGEIIILAIKPSTWFVLFDSMQWIVASILVAIAAGWISSTVGWVSQSAIVQGALGVATLRLGAAILRWASRFYVLTNRRIMRVQGVGKVDVFACPLLNVRTTRVTAGPHEQATGTGCIGFNIEPPVATDPTWVCISQPHEVHAEIRKAIQRAIDMHG